MSFHPLMVYDRATFQKSERKVVEEGPAFTFTPERRAALDEMLTKYPENQKRSAVLGALYLVQEQQGYLTGNGMRHVAGILGLTPAEVEDVATYYVMFYKEPVGKYVLQVCRTLSCALMGAERVTEALSEKLGLNVGETDPSGLFTLMEFECLGACDRAPVVMVNNEHWHEKVRPEDAGKLVDDIKARGDKAFTGCHLHVEP
jgi:NADH-quinone oxidoreductase E subunit